NIVTTEQATASQGLADRQNGIQGTPRPGCAASSTASESRQQSVAGCRDLRSPEKAFAQPEVARNAGQQHRFLRCPSQEGHRRSQHALEGKTMNEKALLALRQSLRIIRRESDVHRARIEYYETVGMLRGLHYGGAIDSWQLLALTELAGSAYINAGKPW
ncbi:hypothetical protein, partial [Pseudomonas sp. BIS]